MAFSGAGTFVRLYTWVTDRINGVPITDTRMDAEMDGFATGLSTCITKDGQTTATAQIPFALGLKSSDGTVALPAIAFTSDLDSGIYRIGANNIGVAVNGAKVLDVSTAGLSVTGTFALNGEVIMRHVINTNPSTPGSGPSNISFGYGAAANIAPITTTLYVTAIGFNAAAALTTADHLTAVGAFALSSFTSQVNAANSAFGIDALRLLTSGSDNVAVGEHAVASATTTSFNTAVGAQTQLYVAGGSSNSSFGQQALLSNVVTPLTGDENTAIGAATIQNARSTAAGNTAVGYQALYSLSTPNYNTAIGHRAGSAITTGNYNVCIGKAGSTTLTTGSDNILIGTVTYPADTPAAGTSAYLNIGGIIKGDMTGATGVVLNKVTITPVATAAVLTIPDGVTLTGPAASGTAMTLGNTETITGVKTFGSAGAVGRLKIAGTTSGTTVLDASATASGTLMLPAATDTLVGKATTDTLTNKTFDTAGSGNSFSINGVAATANTGTGSVVRATAPTLSGVKTSGTITTITAGFTGTGTGGTMTLVTGSNDNAGRILITAGSSAAATGTFTLNFSASLGANSAVATLQACGNTGQWTSPNLLITGQSSSAVTVAWTNGATLTNGSAYIINYHALGT